VECLRFLCERVDRALAAIIIICDHPAMVPIPTVTRSVNPPTGMTPP